MHLETELASGARLVNTVLLCCAVHACMHKMPVEVLAGWLAFFFTNNQTVCRYVAWTQTKENSTIMVVVRAEAHNHGMYVRVSFGTLHSISFRPGCPHLEDAA